MSKRSSRRLAVVAGAALALGSMAPALAARVDGNATGSVELDGVDLGEINGSALPLGLDGLLTLDTVTGLAGAVQAQAGALQTAVQHDVAGLTTTVLGLPGGILTAQSTPIADVDVAANALGIADVDASGVLGAPLGLIGSIPALPGSVLGTVTGLATVGAVQSTVGFATTTALGAVSGVQGTALGLPGALLDGGLEDILGLAGGITGGGNVNLVASLLGTF